MALVVASIRVRDVLRTEVEVASVIEVVDTNVVDTDDDEDGEEALVNLLNTSIQNCPFVAFSRLKVSSL